MSIRYKFNVLSALKKQGYSQTRIRNEQLIGQATLTQLRHAELVSWRTINMICKLLCIQPGDLLEYVPDEEEASASPSASPAGVPVEAQGEAVQPVEDAAEAVKVPEAETEAVEPPKVKAGKRSSFDPEVLEARRKKDREMMNSAMMNGAHATLRTLNNATVGETESSAPVDTEALNAQAEASVAPEAEAVELSEAVIFELRVPYKQRNALIKAADKEVQSISGFVYSALCEYAPEDCYLSFELSPAERHKVDDILNAAQASDERKSTRKAGGFFTIYFRRDTMEALRKAFASANDEGFNEHINHALAKYLKVPFDKWEA